MDAELLDNCGSAFSMFFMRGEIMESCTCVFCFTGSLLVCQLLVYEDTYWITRCEKFSNLAIGCLSNKIKKWDLI